jgi:hypothetical protein
VVIIVQSECACDHRPQTCVNRIELQVEAIVYTKRHSTKCMINPTTTQPVSVAQEGTILIYLPKLEVPPVPPTADAEAD